MMTLMRKIKSSGDAVDRILQQIQSELHHVRRSQDEAQSGGGTEPATRAGGDGAMVRESARVAVKGEKSVKRKGNETQSAFIHQVMDRLQVTWRGSSSSEHVAGESLLRSC